MADVADQVPAESYPLGTQQRVAIARALSLASAVPASRWSRWNLDSLTRFDLQDALLHVLQETKKTVVMVTHDVDEAIYLADKDCIDDGWSGGYGRGNHGDPV